MSPGATKTEAVPNRHRLGRGAIRTASAVQAAAGLVGAAGVALAAAAAHTGGGNLTALAATFAILHAGVVLALSIGALAVPGTAVGLITVAASMLVGVVLFSGDLALIGLANEKPWPHAAPVGGTILILAWTLLAVLAVVRAVRA